MYRFTDTGDKKQAETEKSENLFLYIDLPRFDFPVIFSEPVRICMSSLYYTHWSQEAPNLPSISHTPAAPSVASMATDAHLWSVVDPEIARDNPVEDKHRRLVRSHRSSPYDRELKPNAKIRDELGVSVNNLR